MAIGYGHITTLTANSFITDLLEGHTEGYFTATIFMDVRRASDTIDHTILPKLNDHEICNTAQEWFENYLTSRQQRTLLNRTFSTYISL